MKDDVRLIDANAFVKAFWNNRRFVLFDGTRMGVNDHLAKVGDVLGLIERAPTIDAAPVARWISVKERLPKRDEEVLCLFMYPEGRNVCQNVYYGGGHWLGEGDHVTHWMPLPELPKEE